MIIIGITGSSGSGKTTVSEILNRRSDFRVIDADKCAKEMAKPNSPYLNEIAEKIGNEVILEDGNLNRKLLADYIYHEDEKRAILNNITKKHIDNELKNKIKKIENEAGVKYIIIDAPLLFEMNFEFLCNYTIALIANETLKIDRICKRDKVEKEVAKARLAIQNKDDYYEARADFLLYNNEEDNLEESLDQIIEMINKKEIERG